MNINFRFVELLLAGAFFLIAVSGGICTMPAQSPPQEAGMPFIQNYPPDSYDIGHQNWDMFQDKQGFIYSANGDGSIYQFDGKRWRNIPTPQKFPVRGLAEHPDGTIFFVSVDDAGYLKTDSIGGLIAVSIFNEFKPRIEKYKGNRELGWLESVFRHREDIYFIGNEWLLRWSQKGNRVWRNETGFSSPLFLNDNLHIVKNGQGLVRIANDSLHFVPGSEIFNRITLQKTLYLHAPLRPATLGDVVVLSTTDVHLAVGKNRLYHYDGEKMYDFPTEIDSRLNNDEITDVLILPDHNIAVSSYLSGVMIIDPKGRFLREFNKTNGIISNEVYRMCLDNQKGLWLGASHGISRIAYNASLTYFNEEHGLVGAVGSAVRHNGKMYFSTTQGLLMLDNSDSEKQARFKNVRNSGLYTGTLLPKDSTLLFANRSGIFHIKDEQAFPIIPTNKKPEDVMRLSPSVQDSNIVFVGLSKGGVTLLERRFGYWTHMGQIVNVPVRPYSIIDDKPNRFWLESRTNKVALVEFQKPDYKYPIVTFFGDESGLPKADGEILLIYSDATVYAASSTQLFRFDEAQRRFLPDTTYAFKFTPGNAYYSLLDRGMRGTAWTEFSRDGVRVAFKEPSGEFSWVEKPFVKSKDVHQIYRESDGTIWFNNGQKLHRYQPQPENENALEYPTFIRRVIVNDDSVIFNGRTSRADGSGTKTQVAITSGEKSENGAVLPYTSNALRFEYAALSFDEPGSNQYQHFLEGFDEGRSNWTHEFLKDYTNLPEGDYRFRVRGKNVEKYPSTEAVFSFTILPPWYRTWWAYLLYLSVAFFVLFALRRYEMSRQQLKHRAELEHMHAEKLQEMDRMKSRFFANISHEFRTPLTLILGQISNLLSNQNNPGAEEKLKMSQRNARRLLGLINQLLDLSKLEAGGLKLNVTRGDLGVFVKSLTFTFESAARMKNINLAFQTGSGMQGKDKLIAYFDREKMETIVQNLLSNALKFTPTAGKITVALDRRETNVEIMVQDTGIGIPRDLLPHIFDRFYQVDSSNTREYQGTGIGLALTKELVELHHGEIAVESREGEGSRFFVRFPLGLAHLSPSEIADVDTTGNDKPAVDAEYDWTDVVRSEKTESNGETVDYKPVVVRQVKPSASGNPEIILIVEDNADVRTYIRQDLEHSYRVAEAADGVEGLARAQELMPDLIISDVMMPKMDGYAFSERIRKDEKTSHIPIILLTARAAESDKMTGLEIGVDDYLIKPFSSLELQTRIKNLIALRKKLRQRFSTATVIKPSEISATSADQAFLRRVVEIIETHIGDEKFDVDTLCREVGMSTAQIHRKLRALIDQTPGQLIRSLRLQRAADLLKQNAGNISEVAYQVGFYDHAHLARYFKKQFGCSPSQYRKGEEKRLKIKD